MSQLEQFKQMIEGLPELVRRSLSPTTRVVTECPFPSLVGHTVSSYLTLLSGWNSFSTARANWWTCSLRPSSIG